MAALLAALLLGPALARTLEPSLRPIAAEVARACKSEGGPIRSDADLALLLPFLDEPPGETSRYCRPDPALAQRAARVIAAAPSPESGFAMAFLGESAAQGRSVPRDPAAAEAWLLRAYAVGETYRDSVRAIPQANRDAFLATDAAIALLRGRLRRADLPREKPRLAEALTRRHAGTDLDEAAALLAGSEEIEAQPVRLLFARTLLAGGSSPATRAAAAAMLRGAVSSHVSGPEARALLLSLGRTRLDEARTPSESAEAVDLLAAAALGGEVEPLAALAAAVRRANGGRDPAEIEAPPSMKLALGPDDYPLAALREDVTGLVRLRALIGPDGRVLAFVPASPGQPPLLVEGLRKVYERRGPTRVELPGPRPTPYLWLTLPAVHFNLPG
jgi:hypothetical protein